ncbi:putative 14-3-3 protein [Arabidopsis thaliana]
MENEQSTHVHFASLSSSSERYNETFEEIKKAMKKSVQLKAELSAKERNLVSVGYKNNYRNKVEDELAKICNDILSVINKQLIPSSTTVDSSVLFYNMLADFSSNAERKEATDQSLDAYKRLVWYQQFQLYMTLNWTSVFLNSPESAYQLAKQAFDDAINEFDNLTEREEVIFLFPYLPPLMIDR